MMHRHVRQHVHAQCTMHMCIYAMIVGTEREGERESARGPDLFPGLPEDTGHCSLDSGDQMKKAHGTRTRVVATH